MDEFLLLGWKIRSLRQAKELTQEAFAHQSGVFDQRSISDLERGIGNPTLQTIALVANALGVTIGELFSTENAPDEILTSPPRFVPPET